MAFCFDFVRVCSLYSFLFGKVFHASLRFIFAFCCDFWVSIEFLSTRLSFDLIVVVVRVDLLLDVPVKVSLPSNNHFRFDVFAQTLPNYRILFCRVYPLTFKCHYSRALSHAFHRGLNVLREIVRKLFVTFRFFSRLKNECSLKLSKFFCYIVSTETCFLLFRESLSHISSWCRRVESIAKFDTLIEVPCHHAIRVSSYCGKNTDYTT